MDLAQRLSHLESVHDWHGLVEELEKGIASEGDAAKKAAYHLKLGQVLEEKFLQAVKALKHFQDAYKLNPALLEALEQARAIYWDLGKVNMVQKLLELELRNAPDGDLAATLLLELGDVLCDGGDFERATATYAKALGSSGGSSEEARSRLEDMQVDETSWEARVTALVSASEEAATRAERRDILLRAARLAKRFDKARLEELLSGAYEAEPSDKQAAAMFEGLLADEERSQALLDAQRKILDARSGQARADAAFKFGVRWATRHQNVEIGAKLLEEALTYDPRNEAAFAYLRELWGTKEGDWERLLSLAESTAGEDGSSPFVVAQAGAIAWKQLGNLMRARAWFERLAAVAPDHPTLRAFEAQIGEQLSGAQAVKAPSIPPPPAR
ncbi:MAG TPA: hypothetical protein VLS89_02110, partial [Candidatus Nanopelagicales bacterium]|nr:hypothetical protein [Candidatus Nanopelagicales bacterium]